MEHIDVVFYINLDHRTDRRESIEAELRALRVDPSKIVRISAIKHTIGLIGCVKSHIAALEMFMANHAWRTCMILEDDFILKDKNFENNHRILKSFFDSFETWDMLSLSYNQHVHDFSIVPTHIEHIGSVKRIQTTSGYCVNRHFVPILLDNFRQSLNLIEQHRNLCEYSLDQYWKRIQPMARWYAFIPAFGHQLPSYSDIENRFVEYNC